MTITLTLTEVEFEALQGLLTRVMAASNHGCDVGTTHACDGDLLLSYDDPACDLLNDVMLKLPSAKALAS